MDIDDKMLAAARKSDPAALDRLLSDSGSVAYRMACALTGREDVARGVTRFVLRQAKTHLHRWRDGIEARHWVFHHTVLTVRRSWQHRSDGKKDTLLGSAGRAFPSYAAFIRSLRTLSQQQQEAFILCHAQRLNIRQIAIAMDCSTHAAQMHLRAAEEWLRSLAADAYEQVLAQLADAWDSLLPGAQMVQPLVRRLVRQVMLRRRARRLAVAAAVLGVLAAAAVLGRRLLGGIPN